MSRRFRTQQSGMTLIELMITVGLFSILALGTAASMTAVTRQALKVTNKRDQDMTWYLTQKQLTTAVVNVRAPMFRSSTTYSPITGPLAAVGNQYEPLLPTRTNVFNTSGVLVSVPLADLNDFNRITTIPAADLNSENSFLDPIVNPLMNGAGVPVFQDSFTLRREEVRQRLDGTIVATLRNVYASRCLPIATTRLHSSGSTIDPNAPNKSAAYVFSALTRVPFVNSRVLGNGRVQTWISCCRADTPCVGNNLSQHYLRTYVATYDQSGDRITALQETPSTGEANTIWGMGFMARFNSSTAPTRYEMIMFSLRDLCKVIQVDGCMPLNPITIKSNLSAYQPYFARHFPLRPLILSGSVTPDLSSSGVLRLSQ